MEPENAWKAGPWFYLDCVGLLAVLYLLAYLSVFSVFSQDAIPGEMVAICGEEADGLAETFVGRLSEDVLFLPYTFWSFLL